MSELQDLCALGRELGYTGEELKEFVIQEQQTLRDERQRARDERQQERELRQLEMERERVRAEEEERRLKLEIEKASIVRTSESSRVKMKGPSLPPFDDSKDDFDSYIRRFELFAETAQWPRESWAIVLSSHLTGKALETYSRLSNEEANNYDDVKKALMHRFDCTEEGFRKKFRFSKPESGERVSQFITRLRKWLTRWVELSNYDDTYDGVIDLFLAEQFLQVCGKQLQLHLRERLPLTLTEMEEVAESYVAAHGGFASNTNTIKEVSRAEINSSWKDSRTDQMQRHSGTTPGSSLRCFKCDKTGHRAVQCRELPSSWRTSPETRRNKDVCSYANVFGGSQTMEVVSTFAHMPVAPGRLCGKRVQVLRDTGCSSVVVKKGLVPKECYTGGTCLVRLVNGSVENYPLAEVEVNTPYYSGKVQAICMETPVYDLIIGNVPGATKLQEPVAECDETAAVVTRSQLQQTKPGGLRLTAPQTKLNFTVGDLKKAQKEDYSLAKWRHYAETGETPTKRGNCKIVEDNGLLFRLFTDQEREYKQLVLPKDARQTVLHIAHEGVFGGHLAAAKTLGKIRQDFAWPGMMAEVKRYCQSCDACQKTVPRGKVGKAMLGEMPLIDVPFKRVAVDIIGPIEPRTESRNKYILTMVDYATRYPEAICLPSIETEKVAEGLLEMFSRLGVPEEIVTDRGSQFTSQMMDEIRRLLSINHLPTTPYHAMGNGLVEKFNGTLKSMMRRMCAEQPKTWDRFVPALLFAYREAPQASLGFSPFELLYGRSVRGPLTILKELWVKEEDEEVRTSYQYVFELREKLENTCQLAHEELKKQQGKYKFYYDRKARDRKYKAGEKVLLLLPTANNKLQLRWKGPYTIVEKKGPLDYKINVKGQNKIFHVNMLKKYISRQAEVSTTAACTAAVAVVTEEERESPLMLPSFLQQETIQHVHINPDLNQHQREDINELLKQFQRVMTDVPGRTHLAEHKIVLSSEEVFRCRPYKLPYSLRPEINDELEVMKKMGIISPSDSPYQNSMVIVKKPDGKHRICLDFRRLNSLTVFDSEPMPDPDHLFATLAGSKYYSKLDLSKGYWQVPLEDESKPYTAFATDKGLYHFNFLAFGLVNAPASFNRLMRRVLQGMRGVGHFLDDILIYSSSWKDHVRQLKEVLERLQGAGLTARPSKCYIGMQTLDYLGHVIGGDVMQPQHDKVEKIKSAPRPSTKKELRSFLGLSGYYRKFIPHYSTIASSLTELTKKGCPNQLRWEEKHDQAFTALKSSLSSEPVLALPKLDQEFILRTDASTAGLGAVLLQDVGEVKRPVAYASRKLLPREQRYAVVEKECLALVWGIDKFSPYLYGTKFVLEMDHKPLAYLHRAKELNPRLMRWALLLQPYFVHVRYIKGSENVGADFMSRLQNTNHEN